MREYIKPEVSGWEAILLMMLCDSLTGTSIDDFVDSDEISW
jgi:hypothetical protein